LAYGFLEREDDRVAQTHPIVRYVPVAIIQDSDIGSRQIDADATSTCREQEDEPVAAARLVIFIDAATRSPCAVPPSIRQYSVRIKLIDDMVFDRKMNSLYCRNRQYTAHLAEDQDSQTLCFHGHKEPVGKNLFWMCSSVV
jgi:hypothetical protein